MRPSPDSGLAAVRSGEEWRARVLVVDDNAGTRYQVIRVLKGEGHQIEEAGSGTEALKKVAEFQPDLLVMDVKMPDMLGFEVTEQLRRDPATAHVGILHVSATYTDADSQAIGLGKGADAYLTHPVEPQVLLATVRSLLRIQRYEKQLVELIEREATARQEAERALAVAERVEIALHLSQRRLVRLSESGIMGLAYWDGDGRITDANDAFLEMIGYNRDDFTSNVLTMGAIVPPDWSETTQVVLDEIRTRGVSGHHEKQLVRRDGSRCDVLVAGAALEDGTGLLFALDISDAKRSESQRSRLFEEMESALRGRDEFIAMASHDLRSPLGALQLKLELISQLLHRNEGLPPAELRRHLSGAQGQVTQLGDLLGKLLDTTRVRFGHLVVQWESVDLAEVVTETVDRLRPQCEVADCELNVDAPPGMVGLWDRIRLEQVINNLVSNAIKYGGGSPIDIKVSGDSKTARLDVHDNGPGITPEDQARMFAAFERGRTRGGEGFGLGLWIVRRIVDALGGQIWVQSGSGQGSTFTVTLPRSRGA